MAFGISPQYQVEVQLNDLTKEQFLLFGIESAKKLEWNIGTVAVDGFLAYTKFSMSSWSEEVSVKIDDDKVLVRSVCSGSQLFDWGKNKNNIEHFLWEIKKLRDELPPEEIAHRHEQLALLMKNQDNGHTYDAPYQSKSKFKNFFSLFIPTGDYFITPIVINLNIVIFIVMILSGVSFLLPNGQSLINWGANFRPVTLDGQPWRLFTSCFIHIGIFHLLMNMYALAYVGVLLEPQLGKMRFLIAYISTGLMASTASLWWHDLTISAGASGAIFGLYGVFLSMLATDLIEKSARRTLLTSVLIFVGYNLLNGFNEGIDNAAHLGGLMSGLALGFIFIPSLKNAEEGDKKIKAVFFTLILVGGVISVAYKTLPNDIAKYDQKIKDFADYESMALEFYQLSPNAPSEEKLVELNDRGIFYWYKCLKLIQELDKLSLPEVVHRRDAQLIKYCEFRIKSYELFTKSIKENTKQYQPAIDSLNKEIEGIINALKTGK